MLVQDNKRSIEKWDCLVCDLSNKHGIDGNVYTYAHTHTHVHGMLCDSQETSVLNNCLMNRKHLWLEI